MPDIRELKDQASRYLSKGKYEKAVDVYEELCKLEPRDMQMRVRLGDALVKGGDREGAIGAYRIAAETYAREGFLPRAIAVCKLILELEPQHVATQQTLAQLYAKKSGRPLDAPSSTEWPRPAPPARAPATAPVPTVTASGEEALELDTTDRQFSAGVASAEPTTAAPARASAAAAASLRRAPPPPAEAEGLEIDTADRRFQPGVAASSGKLEVASEELSGIELDTGEGQRSWQGAAAWEAPAAVAPPAPAIAAKTQSTEPPRQAPATEAPRAGAQAEPAISLELELAPEELALPDSVATQGVPLEAPDQQVVVPDAPPSPPVGEPAAATASADAVLFQGAAKAEQPKLPGFSLGEIDLGEPELVTVGATAPAPIVAESLEAALAQSTSAAGSEARSWFAPPEGTTPASLVELGIADVDEDAEIEILTVSCDVPVDAAELPEIPLFSDLSREAFVDLASRCALVRPAAGGVIVQEGSIGASFFVVSSGSVKVCKGDAVVARLKEGSFFGEMALLSGAPRTASVIAEEDTECLEISAALLADLQRRYPHVGQVLKKFARQRLLANVLATSPLFRPFDKQERNALIEKFKSREVGEGEAVLKEGTHSDGLFVLMSGELEVRKAKDDAEIVLASLKEGDVFGEISLLTKRNATATVVAKRRSTVLRLPRETFDEVISTHPQILMLISELSDERLQRQETLVAGRLEPADDGLMLF